jgi:hexokinase
MSRKIPTLEEWLSPLDITTETLCSLAFKLSDTYSHLALHSSEQFLPTPVTKFPSGNEFGEYLALDLGGTNLRVAFVSLLRAASHVHTGEHLGAFHNSIRITHEKSWAIDDRFKVEKAEDLFAWIGDCLAEIVRVRMETANHLSDEIPLGITFSFPMMYVCTSRY